MRVEIILNDDNADPVLVMSNCHQPHLVHLKLVNEDVCGIEVSIEDLKLALRKMAAK